jgi:hypothetical protein
MKAIILESIGFSGKISLKKILLLSGILSSLLYGIMVTAIQYEGYDFTSQSVSELSAIGAPTRALWITLGITYQVLMIAFGLGVWLSADHKWTLRIAAYLILLNYGIASFLWLFASMHQREVLAEGGKTMAETLHIILVLVTVLGNLLTIGFGAVGFSKRFHLYSIVTILILLIIGGLTGPAAAPRIEANLPTPWFGIWERIVILGFLVWIIVLAITLLWSVNRQDSVRRTIPDQRQSKITQHSMIRQPVWQRIALLIILAYEGLGALAGGSLLVAEPDGRLIDMPVEIMHGVFSNFLIPGLILTGLGILNMTAFVAVLRRTRIDWLLAGLGLGGLTVWFIVEIIVLKEFHWLHAMWGLPVLVGCLVTFPLVLSRRVDNALVTG